MIRIADGGEAVLLGLDGRNVDLNLDEAGVDAVHGGAKQIRGWMGCERAHVVA